MSPLKGIDVSNWQGRSFDWEAQHAQGVDFAYIKATEGTTYKDPDFARNWRVAAQRGINRGAYHFFHPAESPQAQVAAFMNMITENGGLLPGDLIAMDYEVSDNLAPGVAATAAATFAHDVEMITKASCTVYTYRDFIDEGYCDGLASYPLWLADPGAIEVPVPPPWNLISFLQVGQRGVDQDYGYFPDVAQLLKLGVPADARQINKIQPATGRTVTPEPAAAAAAAPAYIPGRQVTIPALVGATVTPPAAAVDHLSAAKQFLAEVEKAGSMPAMAALAHVLVAAVERFAAL
jgi:lysozyme